MSPAICVPKEFLLMFSVKKMKVWSFINRDRDRGTKNRKKKSMK